MTVSHEQLQSLCQRASRELSGLYPSLQPVFLVHAPGMFGEVVETGDHPLAHHRAGKTALTLLDKNKAREESGFLGLVIHHDVKWLGLISKETILALYNINSGDWNDLGAAQRDIYRLGWQAVDLMVFRQNPEHAGKFRPGPLAPKRSAMNFARLTIEADIFSGVMSFLHGDRDALETIARERSVGAVRADYTRHAEDYPFCIALEAGRYALGELQRQLQDLTPDQYALYARQMAMEVGATITDTAIRRWWSFSHPAQDMAWRNIDAETILGCAVHTSEDPYIRANGHLICEITGLEPAAEETLTHVHNAFAGSHKNKKLHHDLAARTFEDAVARGVLQESSHPLLSAANEQNEELTEGRILGWCASALQAAGRAFESALSSGVSPDVAARLEFEGSKENPDWDTLKNVGHKIAEKKKTGFAVTLGSIADICSEVPAMAPVLGSIRATMNDPDYLRKLEAANDLLLGGPTPTAAPTAAPSGPAPSGPKLSGPAPVAPSAPQAAPTLQPPAPAPSGPALGGGSNIAARQRQWIEQQRKQKNAAKRPPSQDDRDKDGDGDKD